MRKLIRSLIIVFIGNLFGIFCFVIHSTAREQAIPRLIRDKKDAAGEALLPAKFTTATEKLFELRLTDPRVGEYREFEIKVSNVWGESVIRKIHGWLLPSANTQTGQRLGLGWNGVVYQVISIGGKKNLRADVADFIKFDEERRAWSGQQNALPQTSLLKDEFLQIAGGASPLKASLLIKTGEIQAAAEIWNASLIGFEDRSHNAALNDPYLRLADEWTWALFETALTAHMQGDDEQSLMTARLLASIEERLEGEAARRGFKMPDAYNGRKPRFFGSLDPLPAVLADQERRAGHTGRSPSLAEILAHPQKSARITLLIGKLDESAGRQFGQPGGVMITEDPIVRALIAEGEEAVGPLLQTLETDGRLTRSVAFTRDFFRERHIFTVSSVSYTILQEILKTNTIITYEDRQKFSPNTPEGRRELAARIRAYLSKYNRKTAEARWLAVLSDDQATVWQWSEAAANIIAPVNLWTTPSPQAFTDVPVFRRRLISKLVIQGEPLRTNSSPAVSELITRRIFELAERKTNNPVQENLRTATNFAMALLIWDSHPPLSKISAFQKVLKNRLQEAAGQPEKESFVRAMIIDLYLKRCETGDEAAFQDYADWLSGLKPDELKGNTISAFRPLWRNADHPLMIRLAERLFSRSDSAWRPLIDGPHRQSFYRAELMNSPLVNVKIFRELALAGLADKTVIAVWKRRQRGSKDEFFLPVENTFTTVLEGMTGFGDNIFVNQEVSSDLLDPGSLRICDAYAAMLARLNDAPQFRWDWPEKQRDLAITELRRFLNFNQKSFDSSSNRF